MGTIPPEGRTPSKSRRIVSFLSGHGGVGKSTVAFFSAVAWADWASCKVLYVPFDPIAGERARRRLGIDDRSPHDQNNPAISLSRYGVGVLTLARDEAGLAAMNVSATVEHLAALNRTCDLFIDIDPSAESLGDSLLRESDQAFWVTNPRADLLRSDLKGLRRLRTVDPAAGKVELVANRIGAPAMSDYGGFTRLLDALGTEQIFAVPVVRALDSIDLDRAGENPIFRKAFLPLLIRVDAVRPRRKAVFIDEETRAVSAEEARAAMTLSKKFGIPYASRENGILKVEAGQDLERIIPEEVAREKFVLPLFLDGPVLAVALVDPEDVLLLDDLKSTTGLQIQPFIATKSEILQVIDEFYRTRSAEPQKTARETNSAELAMHAVSLVNAIFKQAVSESASSVIIESSNGQIRIHFRVAGIRQERPTIPKDDFEGVIARLKILSRLDPEERVLPQEGRFSIKVQDRVIEIRVSTNGTELGELAVLHFDYPDDSSGT